jgi:hypothetical protein
MVPITALWLPILVSAVIVFLVSSVIHMATPWHKSDISGVPDEDGLLGTFRSLGLRAGDYCAPYARSMEHMKSAEFAKKMADGPIVLFTVSPGGSANMGTQLTLWFLYSVVIGVFAAYVTGRALGPGADYRKVFQICGAVTFMGYAMALPQNSIWWKRGWGFTLRGMTDALLYGALTAGTFGWLWPR